MGVSFTDGTKATDNGQYSTLSLQLSDLQSLVARYLGFPRDSGEWNADQSADVAEVIAAGLRQFYFPPPIGRATAGHQWSFLHPTVKLETISGVNTYTLPADFANMESELTYSEQQHRQPIPVTSDQRVRRVLQASLSAAPQVASVRPRASDGSEIQSFELILAPAPDDVYTLAYRYAVLPDDLSDDAPYPYGGANHAETIRQSCLAAAEALVSSDSDKRQQALFLSRLAASVSADKQLNAVDFLGYNGDVSARNAQRPVHFPNNSAIRLNGVAI